MDRMHDYQRRVKVNREADLNHASQQNSGRLLEFTANCVHSVICTMSVRPKLKSHCVSLLTYHNLTSGFCDLSELDWS